MGHQPTGQNLTVSKHPIQPKNKMKTNKKCAGCLEMDAILLGGVMTFGFVAGFFLITYCYDDINSDRPAGLHSGDCITFQTGGQDIPHQATVIAVDDKDGVKIAACGGEATEEKWIYCRRFASQDTTEAHNVRKVLP